MYLAYNAVKPVITPRFAGDMEYAYYKAKLKKDLKPQTVDRFALIRRTEVAEYPEHGQHIKLATTFANIDPHIKWFNSVVLELLQLKKTDKDKAEELLSDLRVALEDTLMENTMRWQ